MPRKSTVEKLPDAEFDFVIKAILNGKTDREISAEFEAAFGSKLPKSSLNNWRNKAGNELADRYRMRRFLISSAVENLKADGIEVDDDKYKHIIQNLEDHLLTAERDLLAENPMKLLSARQEDERLKIKREQLQLNRDKLNFEKEKVEKEAAVRVDRLQIAADVWQYVLVWLSGKDPRLADGLTAHSAEILTGIEGHVGAQDS